MTLPLPLGKLPPDLLRDLLADAPLDESVLLGPGIGLDCAVVDLGERLLVLKSDPITFASQQIGWYAVQVNANDIATTGAVPRWFLANLLLPEEGSTVDLAAEIMDQVYQACRELQISVVGGHTEITHGLDRPILLGTMIGEVERNALITPRGACPGDALLLTKGVPIEATAILGREFRSRLLEHLPGQDVQRAADFLYNPGISVVRDARIAVASGRVHAMHDPTEGGLAAALWELAEASRLSIRFDPASVPVLELSQAVLAVFEEVDLNPLECISSGALLLAVHPQDSEAIQRALQQEGIACSQIGGVIHSPGYGDSGVVQVWAAGDGASTLLPRPAQDAITRLFNS